MFFGTLPTVTFTNEEFDLIQEVMSLLQDIDNKLIFDDDKIKINGKTFTKEEIWNLIEILDSMYNKIGCD